VSVAFFDEHGRATIEAAMARIIPTDHDPGAREAGAIDFLDRYLSGPEAIYAKADGSGFVDLDERTRGAWTRRIEALRSEYRAGVEELDRRAGARAGAAFRDLDEADQDAVLRELEQARSSGPDLADAAAGVVPDVPVQQPVVEDGLDFFGLLVLHTRQGFYADPVYGGNRDRVGWRLIGFEGPRSLADVRPDGWSTAPYFAHDQEDA
jgi:gluconate 2-dehydrogenase gamma chain